MKKNNYNPTSKIFWVFWGGFAFGMITMTIMCIIAQKIA